MPRYCRSCILPDTRPGVILDAAGICRGCRSAEHKREIDWTARTVAFRKIVAQARARACRWDCVIPVSGGKDSYWQVVTCLEHGLRPLCVTYVYPGRSALGERNLRRLVALGVDHMEFRVNPEVERRFIAKAFHRTAISGLVTHMAIFAVPIQTAVAHDIPLVVYAENSAFEYGSEDESLTGATLDHRWLERFGVTAGTTAEHWLDDALTRERLAPFFMPPDDVLAAKGIKALFLGYYFPWDPEHSRQIAMAHGFRARPEGPRVGHYDYVNIDDELIGVHHHPKWHKFGITRSWDTLSMEIRGGRLSRDEAISILRRRGDETPWDDIRRFCDYLSMSRRDYFAVLESFRNRDIWLRQGGKWIIEDFLIPDYPWPADPPLD